MPRPCVAATRVAPSGATEMSLTATLGRLAPRRAQVAPPLPLLNTPTSVAHIDVPPGSYSVFGGAVSGYVRPGRQTGLAVLSTDAVSGAAGFNVNLAYVPYGHIHGR